METVFFLVIFGSMKVPFLSKEAACSKATPMVLMPLSDTSSARMETALPLHHEFEHSGSAGSGQLHV